MHIGPVVDLRNYKEYYERFARDLGSEPRCMEFHIINSDLTQDLNAKMKGINEFLRDKNVAVSFHCPDHPLNDLTKTRLENKNPDYNKLTILFDALQEIKQKKFLVMHQGFIANKSEIEAMNIEELIELKKTIKNIASKEMNILKSKLDENTEILLEQSPVFAGANKLVHITDQCLEDFANRPFRMVQDISHIALLVSYFQQNKITDLKNKSVIGKMTEQSEARDINEQSKGIALNWMEALKKEYNGLPSSLNSIEEYLKLAKDKTAWFHLSDANGIYVTNEGLIIGAEKSTINWKSIVELIKNKEFGVLEIIGCEKDYTRIQKSLKYLKISCPQLFTQQS